MDSAYSSLLYIFILIYIICIYYSEINEPNSFTTINTMTTSVIKWSCLVFLIFAELAMAFSLNANKENSDLQTVKILFAIIVTWFLLFTPTIYFYYFGEKCNDFYGKPSIYINSIFENVIGYLFVKNEANNILKKLNIGGTDTDDKSSKNIEMIMLEINKSRAIFINQLNIYNFNNIWEKLFSPLFSKVKSYQSKSNSEETEETKESKGSEGSDIKGGTKETEEGEDSSNSELLDTTDDIKEKLFNLVKRKYIIGKCLWFLYNCIMCLSISLYLVII